MKKLIILFMLMVSITCSGQKLMGNIHFNEPKDSTKSEIDANKDKYVLKVGNASFDKCRGIYDNGLTIGIFLNENSFGSSANFSNDAGATTNKINAVKKFFIDAGYKVVYEAELAKSANALGLSEACAFICQKDKVYAGITYVVQTTGSTFNPTYSYQLFLRVLTTSCDTKKYYLINLAPAENKSNMF